MHNANKKHSTADDNIINIFNSICVWLHFQVPEKKLQWKEEWYVNDFSDLCNESAILCNIATD